jgi:aspartate carbamoyltransferase catalytic subunit
MVTTHHALRPSVDVADADVIPSSFNSKGLRLDPTRLLSAGDKHIDFARLEALAGTSLVRADQLDRTIVLELCKFASLLEVTEIANHHPLDGKLVVTAFFEASTRTRLSFESAVLRLDGKIVSVPDGKVTGIAKGESLADIGEMMNTYGDLVVMRHPVTDSTNQIRQNLQLPLVNAGNGSGEHPTQALVDWYTLLKWRPSLRLPECPERDRIHLGIIGTPGSMRAVKSFASMASLFVGAVRKLTVISEMVDPFGPELAARLHGSGMEIETTTDMRDVLGDLDVIYMNSITFLGDTYHQLDRRFALTSNSPLKESAVIMHPLARNDELDTSLDNTHHNLYFAQAASAVFIRQALLIGMLGRISRLPPSVLLLTS